MVPGPAQLLLWHLPVLAPRFLWGRAACARAPLRCRPHARHPTFLAAGHACKAGV
jgi:hypothetical protein